MKGLMKIITRYVVSAAGIALILLITNILVLILWLTSAIKYSNGEFNISGISEGLTKEGNEFVLAEGAAYKINNSFEWAMLLSDEGKVIWSKNLPQDIPLSYTVSEVAAFSRWYLKDYPVHSWRNEKINRLMTDISKGTHFVMAGSMDSFNAPIYKIYN